MNIEQLNKANKEIERLKKCLDVSESMRNLNDAKYKKLVSEHDQEIKDIEDVNSVISKLADERINKLALELDRFKLLTESL